MRTDCLTAGARGRPGWRCEGRSYGDQDVDTNEMTVCWVPLPPLSQRFRRVLPEPARRTGCGATGRTGSEEAAGPSCPSSPGKTRIYRLFADLRREKQHEGSSLTACCWSCCVLTLDGRGTNDERLLEGLRLGAEVGRSGLQRDPLLSQARDVDGGLLVEAWLVVEQRDAAAEGQRRASCGRHLGDKTSNRKTTS